MLAPQGTAIGPGALFSRQAVQISASDDSTVTTQQPAASHTWVRALLAPGQGRQVRHIGAAPHQTWVPRPSRAGLLREADDVYLRRWC